MGRRRNTSGPSKMVEKLIGLYDGDTIRLSLPRRDLAESDAALYRFFACFSIHKDIEDFGVGEVDHYIREQEKAQRESRAIERDLEHLRAFWNYLIDFHGFAVVNPASRRELSPWAKLRLENPENYRDSHKEFHRVAEPLAFDSWPE